MLHGSRVNGSCGDSEGPLIRQSVRLPFTGAIFANFPTKTHHFASFEASFTRLLTYTQKMCSSTALPRFGLI